ncbi:MAG: hypothetical protein A2Z29_01585 [Chloroflexi bacterium RBG_16_56_11]|nr:MAG: hypothetical protein A2Z29_01585 [Chloroflexi bacterium RBG_16_56_11]
MNTRLANELWAELLVKSGRQWLPVLTGSMSPLIRPGDLVLVAIVDVDCISSGDIVAFWRGGDIVVHRVLQKRKSAGVTLFREKGDVTYFFRELSGVDIIGKIITVKKAGKTFRFTSSFGRVATTGYGLWFRSTTRIVSLFRSSRFRMVKRTGKPVSRLFLMLSRLFLALACLAWITSDSGSEGTGPNPERATSTRAV